MTDTQFTFGSEFYFFSTRVAYALKCEWDVCQEIHLEEFFTRNFCDIKGESKNMHERLK